MSVVLCLSTCHSHHIQSVLRPCQFCFFNISGFCPSFSPHCSCVVLLWKAPNGLPVSSCITSKCPPNHQQGYISNRPVWSRLHYSASVTLPSVSKGTDRALLPDTYWPFLSDSSQLVHPYLQSPPASNLLLGILSHVGVLRHAVSCCLGICPCVQLGFLFFPFVHWMISVLFMFKTQMKYYLISEAFSYLLHPSFNRCLLCYVPGM